MRSHIILVIALWFQGYSVDAFANYSESADKLSLAQLVSIGLSMSPEIQAEKAKVQSATTQIEIEKGGYWPSLQLSAGPANGLYGDLSYDAALSQMLYDWGEVDSNVDSAMAKKRQQIQSLLVARSDSSLEIIEVCFNLYAAREKLKAIQYYQNALSSIYLLVADRFHSQFSDSSEVAKVLKSQAYAKEQWANTQGELYEAESLYRLLLRREPSTLPDFVEPIDIFEQLKLPEKLNEAIFHSPQYLKAKQEIDVAKSSVENANATLKPRLVLQAETQRREIGGVLTSDSSVAIRFQMEISQGLSGYYRTESTAQQVEAARWNLQSVRRDLEREFNSNRENKIALAQRLEALKQQIKQSSILVKTYKDQFVAGLKTVEDLLNSESEKFQLTTQLINASSEYQQIPYRTASKLGMLNQLLSEQDGNRELY